MSAAGTSQGANSAPSGGSAAATGASVGGPHRAAGPSQGANSTPSGGQRNGDSRKRGGPVTTTARRLAIRGRVQGVGFRDAAVQAAFEFGVHGWVRNRQDGRVEALAQGEPEAVERFVTWCRRGPPLARVAEVAITEADVDTRLCVFEMRASD